MFGHRNIFLEIVQSEIMKLTLVIIGIHWLLLLFCMLYQHLTRISAL